MSESKNFYLINGISGSLGTATALALLDLGNRVLGIGRNAPASGFLMSHKDFSFERVTEYSQDEYLAVLEVSSRVDEITHVIMNSGSALGLSDPADVSLADEMFDVNFIIHAKLMSLIIERCSNIKCVCFISSISGCESHGHPLYSAAKAAVIAYARCIGRYLAQQNTAVFSVSPGAFIDDTGYWAKVSNSEPERFSEFVESRLAVSTMPSSHHIAEFVTLLCEHSSPVMAGNNYTFDGGQGRSW